MTTQKQTPVMKKKIRPETEWEFFYYALQFKMGFYPSLLAYMMISVFGIFIYQVWDL